jgi:hypothetical protein
MLAHLNQIAESVTDIAFPGALLSGPATFQPFPASRGLRLPALPALWLSLVLVESGAAPSNASRALRLPTCRCSRHGVLARETGEGEDGWLIPGEILSLLHVTSQPQ